jgi:hypothetical protein
LSQELAALAHPVAEHVSGEDDNDIRGAGRVFPNEKCAESAQNPGARDQKNEGSGNCGAP